MGSERTDQRTDQRTCSGCGVRAAGEHFVISGRRVERCPACQTARAVRLGRLYGQVIGVMALIGVVAALAGSSTAIFGELPITVMWAALALLVAVIVHESGHATAGALLGYRIHGLALGFGPTLAGAWIGDLRLELRATLLGGATVASHRGRPIPRSHRVGLILGGVGAETLLLAAVIALWPTEGGWRDMSVVFRGAEMAGGTQFRGWLLAALTFTIVGNLIPLQSVLGRSDGAALAELLTMDQDQIDETIGPDLGAALAVYGRAGQPDRALPYIEQALVSFPDNKGLQLLKGSALSMSGHWAEALSWLAGRSESFDGESPERCAVLCNNIAWTAVMIGDESLAPMALEHSAYAHDLFPLQPPIAGTRGAALVLAGQPAEGIPLLEWAARSHQDAGSRALNHGWLALAHAALGDRYETRIQREAMLAADPSCPVRDRVKGELAALDATALGHGALR